MPSRKLLVYKIWECVWDVLGGKSGNCGEAVYKWREGFDAADAEQVMKPLDSMFM
jgi:hypothetical protein